MVPSGQGGLFGDPEQAAEEKGTAKGKPASRSGQATKPKGEAPPQVELPPGVRFVNVALNLPLRREFTYRVSPAPDGGPADVQPGHRVKVPFRGKIRTGIVVDVAETTELDYRKVLPIEQLIGGIALPGSVLKLCRSLADTYGCSLGEALDAALPGAAKRSDGRKIPYLELAIDPEAVELLVLELEDKRPEQARVMRAVAEHGAPTPVLQIRRETNTSDSPWKTLVKNGHLRRTFVAEEGTPLTPDVNEASPRHELNSDQQVAVDAVAAAVGEREHKTFLLHGVTGSGKTEVYLRILEVVRAADRSAIVLVPEISLTPQTVGRFAARFPDVAVLHSGLTDAQRGREWRRLLRGEAKVAIGARSALFAPVQDLGLIVVDEEHEGTFKQDSTPRYHAREMAVERGRIENAAVVLGSATPSLESYGRARRGIFELLTLPARAGRGTLPHIMVEDLRGAGKHDVYKGVQLSRTLQVQIEERLGTREQVILFLNRRGYSPVLICPKCGTVVECRRCDVSMTWHARRSRLVCHLCRNEQRLPETCGTCGHVGMHELGTGTERVEEAIKERFPTAVVARMDADTTVQRGSHERILAAFRQRHIDILIGTQMVAKGLDFPYVTLVGVVSCDTGLFFPDYRAAERTFQLLAQVAGRAGRAERPGTVVFQTLRPDHYAISAAAKMDYEGFVQQELNWRKATGYPPFSRLIRVMVDSRHAGKAEEMARQIAAEVRGLDGVEVLGPAPTAVAKVQDRHRRHFLAKCATPGSFTAATEVLAGAEAKGTSSVRVMLDVDPGSVA